MEKYFTIVSDGSCDLPEEIVKEKEIGEVHFLVSFDGKEYKIELVEVDNQSDKTAAVTGFLRENGGGVQCFSADSGTVSK